MRGGSGQVELQGLVFGRFRDGAGCQELVDQALCSVARDGLKGRFFVFSERGERVGVVAEEGAEVESEGLGFGLEVRHFVCCCEVVVLPLGVAFLRKLSAGLKKKSLRPRRNLGLGKAGANAAGQLA